MNKFTVRQKVSGWNAEIFRLKDFHDLSPDKTYVVLATDDNNSVLQLVLVVDDLGDKVWVTSDRFAKKRNDDGLLWR